MFSSSPSYTSSRSMDTAQPSRQPHHLAPRLETPSLTSSTRSSTSSMLASSGSASVHDSGLESTNTGGAHSGSRGSRGSAASPPLIDFDDDEGTPAPRHPLALEAGAGVSPTDKLRALLRLMDDEVRTARPEHPPKQTQTQTSPHVTTVPPAARHLATASGLDADDTESLSPPSPPPRINNYLYSRRGSEPRAPEPAAEPPSPPSLQSSRQQPRRLPSRAIALRAAAAAAAAAELNPEPRRERETFPPTPLESFIAHSTLRVEPSTSRLDDPTPQMDDRDPVPQDTPWHAEPSWRAEPSWLAELSRAEMTGRTEAEPSGRVESRRAAEPDDTPRRNDAYHRRQSTSPREPAPRREPPPLYPATSPRDDTTPRREQTQRLRSPHAETLHRSTSTGNSPQHRARSPRHPRAPSPSRSPPQRPPTLRRSLERMRRDDTSSRLRPGTTPRRRTVDPAPDTSASFAAGLEERQEVIVDIEDDTEVPWADDETLESSDASVPIDLGRGPTARFMVAEELSLSRSRESIGSSPRSPSASRTFATATEGSGRGSTPRAQRPMAVDTSLPELPDPESTDDEDEEGGALARRREMFRPSKTPESSRSYSRSHSRGTSSTASAPASTPRDSASFTDARSTLRQSVRESASLRRSRPKSVRADWSEQFEDAESAGESSTHGRFNSALAEEEEEAFGELASLPQSSPPRVSPQRWRLSSEWKEDSLSSTPRRPVPSVDLGDLGQSDDDEAAYPVLDNSRDSTHDSWRELEAAAALNPPSPVSPRRPSASPSATTARESPALADSDTLPDTPLAPARRATSTSPRSLGSASFREARSFLRGSAQPATAASFVAEEPPRAAPTPLRSALRKSKTPRFPDSPSVRWSPEVLDALDESGEAVQESPAEESEPAPAPAPAPVPVTPVRNTPPVTVPGTTSPPSSPPAHLTTPRPVEASPAAVPKRPLAPVTPLRQPVAATAPGTTSPGSLPPPHLSTPRTEPVQFGVQKTPKPPGAWASPAAAPREVHDTPAQAPPAPPRAPSPSRADVPPITGLPPQMPLPPTPAVNGTAPGAPTPGLSTPRPPGAWYSPARTAASTVPARTSRLRHEVILDESGSSAASSDTSVHKLRLSRKSPRRTAASVVSTEGDTADGDAPATPPREPASPSSASTSFATPTKSPGRLLFPGVSPSADGDALDPDTSWTARIKDLVGSPLRPPRTVARTELAEARFALDAASRASAQARSRVVAAQDAWRTALAAYTAAPAPSAPAAVAARTASWTVWVGWIVLELVLLWGVFRVTLEYATSAQYLSQSDPFGPFAPSYAVGVRLPAGLAAFGKGPAPPVSANLFDILDALGIGPAQHRWLPPT